MTDPIARAAGIRPRGAQDARSQPGAARPSGPSGAAQRGETGVLVRLARPVHRRFRAAALDADVRQADLYRALVLVFLEDQELAERVTQRARLLRDA